MEEPLVSVIMPVYQAEKYIGQSIESILNQSYVNLELIIVDDCGTDRSMDIITQYMDSRIRIFHNEKNRGIAYSRNRAIMESRGKYIAIMDDDDVSMPDRLKHQVMFMENNPSIDVVGGQSSIIDEENNVLSLPQQMQENCKMNKVMFLFYNSFHNSEVLVRKKFLDTYGIYYHDDMLGMEDYLFWIDCSIHGLITNINEEVLQYRVSGQNETSRIRHEQNDERRLLYNKLRRYSLENNGFILSDSELEVINSVINEDGTGTFQNAS